MTVPNASSSLADRIGTVTPTDPATARRAALYVCGAATDMDDAALLVEVLGLRGVLS